MIKKTKLTISSTAKKSIKNIEFAKTQSKNSVVIEKKTNKFSSKSSFSRGSNTQRFKNNPSFQSKTSNVKKNFHTISNDFEKRKLAEQRATRRIKGEKNYKDTKEKNIPKKREQKLTVSAALSDKLETRARSIASLKRAKQKENRDLKNEEKEENYKAVKRNVDIPEAITVRELANRMAEQSSNVIKHLLSMGVTVTINQSLAADTAEYLVKEFGHNPIREKKAE